MVRLLSTELLTVELITTLGFPIFVSLWFMLRTEKVIERNTKAINDFVVVLTDLCQKLSKMDDRD